MNQILVTEKIYVTPELKRKKKLYKVSFVVSLFAIIVLASFYVYAEYDKIKNEEISQDILSELNVQVEETIQESEEEDEFWKIIIESAETENTIIDEVSDNTTEENNTIIDEENTETNSTFITANGKKYKTVGSINIPKIKVSYPILSETSVALLKIAPCKFWGPEPNEIGNLCIAGHNYKNNQFFSKVPSLVIGDIIEITDLSGRRIKYSVTEKYTVVPKDTSCTDQGTNGKKIITLITCTNDNKKRVIVHAKEII